MSKAGDGEKDGIWVSVFVLMGLPGLDFLPPSDAYVRSFLYLLIL